MAMRRPDAKAETCLGCHAVRAISMCIPSYRADAGRTEWQVHRVALKQYRDGGRQHDTMHANAANLSDQDMADIGAYIESYRNK
ncbi:MAG: cytochrome c [Proteobacteria bacterium]|nr:cytochrome c [Pseudomonadota bacterium]